MGLVEAIIMTNRAITSASYCILYVLAGYQIPLM